MSLQTAIDITGKLLPVFIDLAGMIPGVSIPVGAVRVIGDVIQVEQAAHLWLTETKEGQKVLETVKKIGVDLGADVSLAPDGKFHFETRSEVEDDFAHGHA